MDSFLKLLFCESMLAPPHQQLKSNAFAMKTLKYDLMALVCQKQRFACSESNRDFRRRLIYFIFFFFLFFFFFMMLDFWGVNAEQFEYVRGRKVEKSQRVDDVPEVGRGWEGQRLVRKFRQLSELLSYLDLSFMQERGKLCIQPICDLSVDWDDRFLRVIALRANEFLFRFTVAKDF